MAKAAAALPERSLRVALLWNGALQAEQILAEPREIKLGSSPDAMFALPNGVVDAEDLTVLSADASGYAVQPHRALGGFVYVAGARQDAASLRAPQKLGPQDYGVVTVGSLAVFFQHVAANQQALPQKLDRDFAVLASIGFSLFMHVTLLLFLFLIAAKEFAPAGELAVLRKGGEEPGRARADGGAGDERGTPAIAPGEHGARKREEHASRSAAEEEEAHRRRPALGSEP